MNETTDSGPGRTPEDFKLIAGGDQSFPPEYSISGWFKWQGIYSADNHLIYRFTINNKPDNLDDKRLGDRTLAVFASRSQFYTAATYNYTNMNGAGNPSVQQNLNHQGFNQ